MSLATDSSNLDLLLAKEAAYEIENKALNFLHEGTRLSYKKKVYKKMRLKKPTS